MHDHDSKRFASSCSIGEFSQRACTINTDPFPTKITNSGTLKIKIFFLHKIIFEISLIFKRLVI